MRHPRVMLLDEPAAGLINSEIDELDSIIRHFAREMNIGVMLVEHRLELLSAIADGALVWVEIRPRGAGDACFE